MRRRSSIWESLVQENAPPGITVRCVNASDETLPSVIGSGKLNKQKNNTMSCETKDGKVLSTFSGKFWELVTWVRGPACSDGIDQRCEYLGSIQKLAHEDVIVECIEDKGKHKYTLACKNRQDNEGPFWSGTYKEDVTVLSTTTKKHKKLRKWVAGPLCQPRPICPGLREISELVNLATGWRYDVSVECLEDNVETYKLGCYVESLKQNHTDTLQYYKNWESELYTTKTGTTEELKKWATGPECAHYPCHCSKEFASRSYNGHCTKPNTWICSSYTDGKDDHQLVHVKVKSNKKKHCKKALKKSNCNPKFLSKPHN